MSSKRFEFIKNIFANDLIKEANEIPTFLNTRTLAKELSDVNDRIAGVSQALHEAKLRLDYKTIKDLENVLRQLEVERKRIQTALKSKAPQIDLPEQKVPKRESVIEKNLSEKEKMEELRRQYEASKSKPEAPTFLFRDESGDKAKTKEKKDTSDVLTRKEINEKYKEKSAPETATEADISKLDPLPTGEPVFVPKPTRGKLLSKLDEKEKEAVKKLFESFEKGEITQDQLVSILKESDIDTKNILDKLKEIDFKKQIQEVKKLYHAGITPEGIARKQIKDLAEEQGLTEAKVKTLLKDIGSDLGPETYDEILDEEMLFSEPDKNMPFAPIEKKDEKTTVFSPGESKVVECKSCGLLNDPWNIITIDDESRFVERTKCARCKEKLDGDIRPAHEFTTEKVRVKSTKDLDTRKSQKLPGEILQKTRSVFEDTQGRLAKNFLTYNINVEKDENGLPLKDKAGMPIPLKTPIGMLAKDFLKLIALDGKPEELKKMIDEHNKKLEKENQPPIVPMRRAVNTDDPKDVFEIPSLHAWNLKKLVSIPEIKERYLYATKVLIPRETLNKTAEQLKQITTKYEEYTKSIQAVKDKYQPYEAYHKLDQLIKNPNLNFNDLAKLPAMEKEYEKNINLYQTCESLLKLRKLDENTMSEKQKKNLESLEKKVGNKKEAFDFLEKFENVKNTELKLKLEQKIGKKYNQLKKELAVIGYAMQKDVHNKYEKIRDKFISATKALELDDLLDKDEYPTGSNFLMKDKMIPMDVIEKIQTAANKDAPPEEQSLETEPGDESDVELETPDELIKEKEALNKAIESEETPADKTASRLERIISIAISHL